jgi:hypothetical protein
LPAFHDLNDWLDALACHRSFGKPCIPTARTVSVGECPCSKLSSELSQLRVPGRHTNTQERAVLYCRACNTV